MVKINPSLRFAIENRGKFDAIIAELRRKHGKDAKLYLESTYLLGGGLNLLDIEKYFTALK